MCYKPPIRHRQRQRILPAFQDLYHFLRHHLQRHVIRYHMMKHQYGMARPPFFFHSTSHAYGPQIQQRWLRQIHRKGGLIQIILDALQDVTPFGNLQRLRHQLSMPMHHLHHLRQIVPKNRRAQHIMSRNYPVQGMHKVFKLLLRIKRNNHPHYIGIIIPVETVIEQHPFLQRC